jgi:transposase
MNKLIDILRLHFDANLSQRTISKTVNISRSTVGDYLNRFKQSGIPWPLEGKYLNEDTLSQALKSSYIPQKKATCIDFFEISKELRKHKNLTLQLLHSELIESGRIQGSYSNFALQYRTWLGKQPKYMRQTHKSGDKTFTDYSGKKIKIIDTDTGELREVELFVGVLGASTYIYLEATWSQTLPDWVSSHARMFEHFNGSTNLVVPDNLASGVTKAARYDPEINATYSQMLAYYGSAAMPARVYTPKDKELVSYCIL